MAPTGTNLYGYQYTSTGRLSQVTQNSVLYQSYGYDGNGNRTSVITATSVDSATYDAQDRLLSYGLLAHGYTRYSYTTSGELTQKVSSSGTSTYTYDELGNLIAAHPAGGPSIVYLIEGANRRMAKVVNGTYTKGWLYQNGLNIVAELNAAAQVVSRFVYGSRTNVPDYMVQGSTTYRIISDALGSVRLVVNATTGAVAQRLEYDAWGNVLTDTSPGLQPFGFAGGLYDPDTKLVRFGARDYDASVGRWTCKDPIGFAGGTTSLMAYAAGVPVNRLDPTGTDVSDDLNDIAGSADALTCGLASNLRDKYFSYNDIDKNSGAYKQGQREGRDIALAVAIGVAGDILIPELAVAILGGELSAGLAESAAEAAQVARRFTPDQSALVDLAQHARRAGGLVSDEAEIMRAWSRELGVELRGPEVHPGRPFCQFPHYHIGPIDHIPALP